ncbi:MAG: signal recognition particle-docking protein FtsY [Betaproteobacteria bacterium]|nr:signal recognition particle-docking protein FtsY [Betaproteobacteria bacterium]MBI2959840.1 signal recognition particle-docking protein FtsY [Betaproteobacteria bacterium]
MLGLFKKSDSAAKPSWIERLKSGLQKTRSQLGGLFSGRRIDEALFSELEAALLAADAGVDASGYLLAELRRRARDAGAQTAADLKSQLHAILVELLTPLEKTVRTNAHKPFIIMVAGVNGAGKTTSIGKLAHFFQGQGRSVLLAAGDTFRAAAREQLVAWGERNNVPVISQQGGDPAAIIFDAIQAARARVIDIVIADTAGRLPTQLHLMQEVQKIKRVIAKTDASAPHEIWLVLDANTGQNSFNQVRAFDGALGLTGLILTKLDGTAKGGVVAAIARSHSERTRSGDQTRAGAKRPHDSPGAPIPLLFVGVGEAVDDLRPFRAEDFVTALLDR